MKSIELKKVRLKSDFCLELEYTETVKRKVGDDDVSTTSDIVATYRYPVHQDLKDSLSALVKYVAHICEQIVDLDDCPDFLKDITVTGVSFGGSDDHRGATVIAQRKLRSGKVLNLISPFTKFDSETSDYVHCYELDACCEGVVSEVNFYLGGKYAPDPQLELEFTKN